MAAEIKITVDRQNVPPGMVLIDDVASLAKGLHDSVLRIIQNDLGYPCSTRLRDETKKLASMGLCDVNEGSGVLQFSPIPIDGLEGRHPAVIATSEIVRGIETYRDTGQWPAFLPSIVRKNLGEAVEPIMGGVSYVELNVSENGTSYGCRIDNQLSIALQEPEKFSSEEPVELVGSIFEVNIDKKTFRVNAITRRVIVEAGGERFNEADSFRWRRVFILGFPKDEKCNRLTDIQELRLANNDEEDGISIRCDIPKAENLSAYQNVKQRVQEFLSYGTDWDTYKAAAPSKPVLEFALSFLRDAFSVLQDYNIPIPDTFVVPTKVGGVQFEWDIENRELELEVVDKNIFKYLAIINENEKEGPSSRWQAIRLLRWVITGEEI